MAPSSAERSLLASRSTAAEAGPGRATITASKRSDFAPANTIQPLEESCTAATVVLTTTDAGFRRETSVSASDCIPFFSEVKRGGAGLRGPEDIFLRAVI